MNVYPTVVVIYSVYSNKLNHYRYTFHQCIIPVIILTQQATIAQLVTMTTSYGQATAAWLAHDTLLKTKLQ
jgi:hypothetical protein